MENPARNNLIDDLWEMFNKLGLWLESEGMESTDRRELTSARQSIRNVLNRQLGDNYLESNPYGRSKI
jgi:hypothetical protein